MHAGAKGREKRFVQGRPAESGLNGTMEWRNPESWLLIRAVSGLNGRTDRTMTCTAMVSSAGSLFPYSKPSFTCRYEGHCLGVKWKIARIPKRRRINEIPRRSRHPEPEAITKRTGQTRGLADNFLRIKFSCTDCSKECRLYLLLKPPLVSALWHLTYRDRF